MDYVVIFNQLHILRLYDLLPLLSSAAEVVVVSLVTTLRNDHTKQSNKIRKNC